MIKAPVNRPGSEGPSADATLFAACVAGDLAAFAQLVARHQALVCAIAFSTVGDRALSEDVAQETFLALWNSRDRIRDPQKLPSWLCNTARNLGRNAVRGRRTVALEDHHELASEVTPFDQLAEQQENRVVWDALAKLPETYREPLVLYCRDGQSIEGVALALGLTQDAAKQRVARGRSELKSNLEHVERQLSRSGPRAAFGAAVIAAIGARVGAAQAAAMAGQNAASGTATAGTAWLRSWGLGRVVLVGVFVIGAIVASVVALRSDHDAAGSGRRSVATTQPHGKSAPSPHTAGREEASSGTTPDPAGDLRLEGLVVDSAGKPIADAVVTISTTPSTIVRSDEGGSFAVERLLPRIYRLTARHSELASRSIALLVTETTEPVILELRRGATLDVTVIDELSGRPVPGASVTVQGVDREIGDPSERAPVSTDPLGKARVTGLVDSALLKVRAHGFGIAAPWIKVPGDGVVFRRTIFLDAARSVTGSVRDRDGKPMAGVQVFPRSAMNGFGSHVATTDATGAWQFSDLPPASYLFEAFEAKGRGAGHTRSRAVDLIAHDASEPVELVIDLGAKLGGRVVDAQQHPVPYAHVELMGRFRTNADVEGKFVIDHLDPGPVQVFASRYPDASPLETLEIKPGIDREDLVLTVRPSVIRGVVKVQGQPVAGVGVVAMASDAMKKFGGSSGAVTVQDVTNAAGEFVLGPLPDDSYLIAANRHGLAEIMQNVTPETMTHARPGDSPLEIVLPSGGTLTGTVVRSDGGPIDGLAITLGTFEAGLSFSTPHPLTSATFRLDDIPAGTLVLGIAGEGVQREVRKDIQVTAGQTTNVGTITMHAGHQISGRVVTKEGTPVPNALVMIAKHLMGDDRGIYFSVMGVEQLVALGAHQTRTDLDGRFRLGGLDDGPLLAMADSRGLGRSEAVEIKSDTADLVMIVEPTARVSGQITSDGRPVAAAWVTARVSKQVSFYTRTDERGRYDFARLGAGTYALEINQGPTIGGSEDVIREVVVTAGNDVQRDLDLGRGLELIIELDLRGARKPLMGGIALISGQVSASSLAELEKLPEHADAQKQMVMAARGLTKIVFPRAKPGSFSACIVLGIDMASKAPTEASAVGCFPVVVAASPHSQTVSIIPRLP